MSENKNLLNESQIRQFMKLASLGPLTPGFVRGLTETTAEEDLEESHGRGRNEGAGGYGSPDAHSRLEELADEAELEGDIDHDMGDDSLEGDVEAVDDEAELDAEVAVDDSVGDQMISVQDLMTAITTALEEVTGQSVESEIDGEVEDEAPELDAELGDVEAVEDVAIEDEMMQETTDEEVTTETTDEEVTTEATDELVEQVTKRVAARILKSALSKKK